LGLRAEQRVELAGAVERGQVVEAADVPIADPDLRHRATAAALDHLVAPLGVRHDVDLGPGLSLRCEQALRAVAVGAVVLSCTS
jgi:hypothetical protein